MNDKDTRYRERLENYTKALGHLHEALAIATPSQTELAGTIQLFEVVFELGWKTMKDYLESKGFMVNNPRDVIKQAFEVQVVTDGEGWLKALADRNATTHLYDEGEMQRIVEKIKNSYVHLFNALAPALV
jgi:nucleotidyltransferase substrate binding protein (TIGR01987 family)